MTVFRSVMICVSWVNTLNRTTSQQRKFVSLNAVRCVSAPVCPTPALDMLRVNHASLSRWTGSVKHFSITLSGCLYTKINAFDKNNRKTSFWLLLFPASWNIVVLFAVLSEFMYNKVTWNQIVEFFLMKMKNQVKSIISHYLLHVETCEKNKNNSLSVYRSSDWNHEETPTSAVLPR